MINLRHSAWGKLFWSAIAGLSLFFFVSMIDAKAQEKPASCGTYEELLKYLQQASTDILSFSVLKNMSGEELDTFHKTILEMGVKPEQIQGYDQLVLLTNTVEEKEVVTVVVFDKGCFKNTFKSPRQFIDAALEKAFGQMVDG